MKNEIKDEIVLFNAERSIVFMLVFTAITVGTDYAAWHLLKTINPWGFMVVIPALLLSFQLLWLALQPFATVYEDRLEITQSFIHKKQVYFTDLQKIQVKKSNFIVQYNDDDLEKLSLFGIRTTHIPSLHKLLEEKVQIGLKNR